MKVKEINKRYTEIVMEYMTNGYYFNTTTMNGSQGEIAHTDLTDGETIIRIVMDNFRDWESQTEGIEIIVGKCTDESVKPNCKNGHNTIWNNRLEVIRSEKFYQVVRVVIVHCQSNHRIFPFLIISEVLVYLLSAVSPTVSHSGAPRPPTISRKFEYRAVSVWIFHAVSLP